MEIKQRDQTIGYVKKDFLKKLAYGRIHKVPDILHGVPIEDLE